MNESYERATLPINWSIFNQRMDCGRITSAHYSIFHNSRQIKLSHAVIRVCIVGEFILFKSYIFHIILAYIRKTKWVLKRYHSIIVSLTFHAMAFYVLTFPAITGIIKGILNRHSDPNTWFSKTIRSIPRICYKKNCSELLVNQGVSVVCSISIVHVLPLSAKSKLSSQIIK